MLITARKRKNDILIIAHAPDKVVFPGSYAYPILSSTWKLTENDCSFIARNNDTL